MIFQPILIWHDVVDTISSKYAWMFDFTEIYVSSGRMCLIRCLILNGHMYLSGVLLGMNLRPNTTKTCVKKRLDYVFTMC